jgi:hypothetical protein
MGGSWGARLDAAPFVAADQWQGRQDRHRCAARQGAAAAAERVAAKRAACCAVLCCAVLWCAVLCCAVLCCAVLCCAVLCCAVLCCAVLCCAVLCCAVLCCAVLCCMLCCAWWLRQLLMHSGMAQAAGAPPQQQAATPAHQDSSVVCREGSPYCTGASADQLRPHHGCHQPIRSPAHDHSCTGAGSRAGLHTAGSVLRHAQRLHSQHPCCGVEPAMLMPAQGGMQQGA